MTAAPDERAPFWRRAYQWVSSVSFERWQLFAFVIAAIWAISLLIVERNDRRVDAALSHAERFISGDGESSVGAARHLLERRWYDNSALVEGLRIATSSTNVENRQVLIDAFVRSVIVNGSEDPPGVRIAIARIADNLDLVAACAFPCDGEGLCFRMASCHPATVRAQFCDYALSFHELYRGELIAFRELFGLRDLGLRSERFANGGECG